MKRPFHLSDELLLADFAQLIGRDRTLTAELLDVMAEVDRRKLYLPAGYPSMHLYCIQHWSMSDDAAYKRIQAARVVQDFPVIVEMVADGRLHLTAINLLAPHLTPENARGLLAEAAGRTKLEIEEMIARRFPRTELLTLMEQVGGAQLAPAQVGKGAGGLSAQLAPAQAPRERAASKPSSSQSYALHVTIESKTYELLREAQDLLSHRLPAGEVAQVLHRALTHYVDHLRKRKFAATDRPRGSSTAPSSNPRHIPAEIRRVVAARDGGQCTYVSKSGHRCPARSPLEFDHVEPVARGGKSTAENLRLRCRAHNQFEAERTFGVPFMESRREVARARRREQEDRERAEGVIPALTTLGYRLPEARRAAELCERMEGASLEAKVRRALSYFRPRVITAV